MPCVLRGGKEVDLHLPSFWVILVFVVCCHTKDLLLLGIRLISMIYSYYLPSIESHLRRLGGLFLLLWCSVAYSCGFYSSTFLAFRYSYLMLFILYFRLVRAYSFDDMCPFRGVFLRVHFLVVHTHGFHVMIPSCYYALVFVFLCECFYFMY